MTPRTSSRQGSRPTAEPRPEGCPKAEHPEAQGIGKKEFAEIYEDQGFEGRRCVFVRAGQIAYGYPAPQHRRRTEDQPPQDAAGSLS